MAKRLLIGDEAELPRASMQQGLASETNALACRGGLLTMVPVPIQIEVPWATILGNFRTKARDLFN